ncbi:hypothetical protein ETH_00002160 [Eimeria tenella]|uniref:Uncharacterized protein n=1 Tax=Eimeria tenella TaxID=5802 RepID=U6L8Q2_EIMTE|nr:hypothetical protein ETH_00002160 [Eimeria tenella]CDJ45583.1 hypothetical protein ETH_00002160 [Eimeria tenella]|eukprot:XP_013236329.1 hypothetical protein ETH_00002160 [Eimeria tenella]
MEFVGEEPPVSAAAAAIAARCSPTASAAAAAAVTAAAAAAAAKSGAPQPRRCLDRCERRWPLSEPQALASQLAKVGACKEGCSFGPSVTEDQCGDNCRRLLNRAEVSLQDVGLHDAMGACVAGCRGRSF